MIEKQLRIFDYLRIKQAARMLGVSPSTLRNWDVRKVLSPYRHPVNGYRLYKYEDIKEMLSRVKK